jgi:hypothetical protein
LHALNHPGQQKKSSIQNWALFKMPDFLRVADGQVTKNRIDEAESAQYEALKKSVLASQAQKEQEQRERRISQGLPPGLSPEEKREAKRQAREERMEEKRKRKESLGRARPSDEQGEEGLGKKFLGCLCFGP